MSDIEKVLEEAGLRPTSNRIIVFRTLSKSKCPMSLGDLELSLGTLDKSSIFRVLSLFLEHHLIHDIEDGKGVIKYELCSGHENGKDTDMHVHFYCEKCEKLICFEDLPAPLLTLPETYRVHGVNYTVKGICPDCQ